MPGSTPHIEFEAFYDSMLNRALDDIHPLCGGPCVKARCDPPGKPNSERPGGRGGRGGESTRTRIIIDRRRRGEDRRMSRTGWPVDPLVKTGRVVFCSKTRLLCIIGKASSSRLRHVLRRLLADHRDVPSCAHGGEIKVPTKCAQPWSLASGLSSPRKLSFVRTYLWLLSRRRQHAGSRFG